MIQRSGIRLGWKRATHTAIAIAIAIAGCGKKTPSEAPARVSTPTVSEPSHEATAEPNAEPAMAPAPAEAVVADAAATVEQGSATSEPKPQVSKKPPVSGAPAAPASVAPSPKKPKVALSVPEPPEYVYQPQVLMSQQHADSCLVKVGDPFPVAQLSDLEGQAHSLRELFGEKLTVIVFWANENRLGREQIQRLQAETVLPFANTGLSVVAINTADPPEQIRDLLPAVSEAGFTILLDPERQLFYQVATGGHPRTYLLDATGKVLWFDIEYSRSMARNLANAIHVYLGGPKTSDYLDRPKSSDS